MLLKPKLIYSAAMLVGLALMPGSKAQAVETVITFDDFQSADAPGTQLPDPPPIGLPWQFFVANPLHVAVENNPESETRNTSTLVYHMRRTVSPVATLISPISAANQALITGNGNVSIQFKYYESTADGGVNGVSLIANQMPPGTNPTGNSSTGYSLRSGIIAYTNYGTSPAANTYTLNDWHDVRLDLDFTTKTYTTFIDEVQDSFTPAPFVNFDQTTVTNVWFGNFANPANWYFDDFRVTTTGVPAPPQREWNNIGTGLYTAIPNWTPTFVPNAADHQALFGTKITAPSTVIIDSPITLNGITFNNSNKYALSGNGSITLAGTSPLVSVTSGSHEIQVQVTLGSNTTVNATGGSIDFNNQIDLAGKTLTTSGTVNINGGVINTVGSGSGMFVNEGTLAANGSTSIAGDLVNHGTLAVNLQQGGGDQFNVLGSTAWLVRSASISSAHLSLRLSSRSSPRPMESI